MNPSLQATDLIAALDLPPGCQVDRRVPKTLLTEHGASTSADRRAIAEGIEECRWVATIKPETAAVPAFQDAERVYLEIHVLVVVFRQGAKQDRLTTILHRAIPYPIVLLGESPDPAGTSVSAVALSLAHQRRSQVATQATVLDGDPLVASLASDAGTTQVTAFRQALALHRQPRASLFALYQGWIDTAQAWQAAQVTGMFTHAATPERAALRREALTTCARIRREMAAMHAAAAAETQLARRVELNQLLKQAEAALVAAQTNL